MTTLLRPDQTFYPSPQMACKAPAEKIGYVATVVYKMLGLKVLRQSWINFDLIWAVALLMVGAAAFYVALTH